MRVGHADLHITRANQQREMHICLFAFERTGKLTVITVKEKSACCDKMLKIHIARLCIKRTFFVKFFVE